MSASQAAAADSSSSSASPSCFSFFSAIREKTRRHSRRRRLAPIPDSDEAAKANGAEPEALSPPSFLPSPAAVPTPAQAKPAPETTTSQLVPSRAPVVSRLETLPFEIQRLILTCAPTVEALRALVCASPRLHAVYVEDRLAILRGVVERGAFEGFFVDARAACRSGTEEFQLGRTQASLWGFVEEYKQWLAGGGARLEMVLEELVRMVRFQRVMVEPLTERYAAWALAALGLSSEEDPLSDTERRRIQRGFYRFQVFCNVCGFRGKGQSAEECIGGWESVDCLRVLSLFPAWQIEEILCVHAFVKDVYGGVFDQVAWDLDEERNPRYRDAPGWPDEFLELFSSPECRINTRSLDNMIRQGLTVLSDVLKITDHEELVQMVRCRIEGGTFGWADGDWITDIVGDLPQSRRFEQYYSERDAAQDRADKMPFDADAADMPPLAWVTYWRGEESNLFGYYVPGIWRRWGYVMWDAARLRASGAMGFLEIESRLDYWEPREDIREENWGELFGY